MKKAIALGILIGLGAFILLSCTASEIRTVKIEMKAKSPSMERIEANLIKAQEAYPNDPEVYHLWGRYYAMMDNYVEMDKSLKKSDELGDDFKAANDTLRMSEWDVLYKAAIETYKKLDYESTLKDMKDAIICWPNQYDPFLYGADCAYRLGDSTEAYTLSKQAYELVPDSLRVIQQYADMSFINSKYDEALGAYEIAKGKDPTNASIYFSMSEIYLAKGDTAKAVVYSLEGLDIDKNYPEGWLNISKLYFLTKDYCKSADAFEHYTGMIEEAPILDDEFLYVLSVYQCEDYEKAKTVLQKLTMDYPEYCEGWQLLANTYARLKMKKEAMDANKKYDECLKK